MARVLTTLLAALFMAALLSPPIGWCVCSGSGMSWNCTSGSITSDVQSAINSASDGAIITFAKGDYAFKDILLNQRNGITLICETIGGCNITSTGDPPPDSLRSLTENVFYRIISDAGESV